MFLILADCPQINQSHQSHHSRTGLMSHIFYACCVFSYLYVSFFYVLSLTMKNLTNQMVADQGLILLLSCAFRILMLKYILIVKPSRSYMGWNKPGSEFVVQVKIRSCNRAKVCEPGTEVFCC